MIRFKALTGDSSGDESTSFTSKKATTKEAEEAEAFALYNQALALLKQRDIRQARDAFRHLLSYTFIREAAPLTSEDEGLVHPGLVLKYSTYKNLAAIASQNDRPERALDYYLEAVNVDATDVTVWYKIGNLALSLDKHLLAKFAFEQGLECSPRHWPCMDNLIPVLYALNSYEVCLLYLSRALQRDPGYIKGKVFLQKIISEQPSLKQHSEALFKNCDIEIFSKDAETQKGEKYVKEALTFRRTRQGQMKVTPPPTVSFLSPLRSITWRSLGEALIVLYDDIDDKIKKHKPVHIPEQPRVSFTSKVDLSSYEHLTIAQSIAMAADLGPILPSLAPPPVIVDPPSQPDTPVTESGPGPASGQADDGGQADRQADMDMDLSQTDDGNLSDGAGDMLTGTLQYTDTRTAGAKRGRKRKFHPLGEAFSGKRRSARVRNTVTKKDEVVDFHELLGKFLPISMLEIQDSDTEDDPAVTDAMDTVAMTTACDHGNMVAPHTTSLVTTENKEVQEFLQRYQDNRGVLHLLGRYLHTLTDRAKYTWPDALCPVFMTAYTKYRRHIEYPDFLCRDESDARIKEMAMLCLTYLELQQDVWMSQRANNSQEPSPHKSPGGALYTAAPSSLDATFPGDHTTADLTYLMMLSVFRDILGDHYVTFGARVYWLHARFMVLQSDMDWAVDSFARTKEYLELKQQESKDDAAMDVSPAPPPATSSAPGPGDTVTPSSPAPTPNTSPTKAPTTPTITPAVNTTPTKAPSSPAPLTITLPNCKQDKVISLAAVDKAVESLKRCQSLEAVTRLYEEHRYDLVVELLLQTFVPSELPEVSSRERHMQLLLLQDSLLQLQDFKRCLVWSETSLHEAMKQYFSATSMVKQEWLATVCQLMDGISVCLSSNPDTHLPVPSKTRVRLVHNLTRLIQKTMDSPSSAVQMSIPTMAPWTLLYQVIKNEEKLLGPMAARLDENVMPCGLLLLNLAHDSLGRRGWCVHCDGSLLLFTVERLTAELAQIRPDVPHPYREDIELALEQAFYCLYNHPNKRTRARRLEDHNVDPVVLSWERAQPLFQYFKPKTMPEYDSYRASTVSAELENLLRKISLIVPVQEDPVNTLESVTAYIEGASNKPPIWPHGHTLDMPIVDELYYLLADYYFKNKEQLKAIKFYKHDLCTNPRRFDAWAGMALACASRLEQKLASHELRPEVSLQRQAICTLRCFRRALELEPSNTKLWVEYGSIAYQLQAYASRQLKQKSWHPFTSDQLDLASSNKTEMLSLAQTCYEKATNTHDTSAHNTSTDSVSAHNTSAESSASHLEEEQWLPHYMLGKVAEKLGAEPGVYLQHYKLAAKYLHDDRAKYPKKITFYNNAPHLALESVEMFYRLNVSVLKYLLVHGDDPDLPLDLLETYVNEAADGPFARCQEPRRAERKAADRPDGAPADDDPATDKKRPQQHPDHTYSKEKMTSESSEQSSQESDAHTHSQDSSAFSSPARGQIDIPKVRASCSPVKPRVGSPPFGKQHPASQQESSQVSSVVSVSLFSDLDGDFVTPVASSSQLPQVTPSPEIDGMDFATPLVMPKTAAGPVLSLERKVTARGEQVEKQQHISDPNTAMFAPKPFSKGEDDQIIASASKTLTAAEVERSIASMIASSDSKRTDTSPAVNESLASASSKASVKVITVYPKSAQLTTSPRVSSFSMASILGNTSPKHKQQDEQAVQQTSFSTTPISTNTLELGQHDTSLTEEKAEACSQAGEKSTYPDPPVLDKEEPMEVSMPDVLEIPSQEHSSPPRINQADPTLNRADIPHLPLDTIETAEDTGTVDALQLLQAGYDDDDDILCVDGNDDRDKVIDLTSPQRGQSLMQQGQGQLQPQPLRMDQSSSVLDEQSQLNPLSSQSEFKAEVMMIGLGQSDKSEIKQEESAEQTKATVKDEPSMETVNTKDEPKLPSDMKSTVPPPKVEETPVVMDTSSSKEKNVKDDTTFAVPEPKVKLPDSKPKEAAESTKEAVKAADGEKLSRGEWYKRLMEKCMSALRLCLQRLPQHHKSLYNLAYVYYHSKDFKNMEFAQDLLLGTTKWAQLSHMPCPGLLHERKQNNFFQGLWKLPIEEIDRSGSFAAHLTKSVTLLFDVLEARQQSKTLYNIHHQLMRAPDAGKKYIRDADRTYLAGRALEVCVRVLDLKASRAVRQVSALPSDPGTAALLEVYKVWGYGVKQRLHDKELNIMLVKVYRAVCGVQGGFDSNVLEQCIKYCQQHQQLQMAAKGPTHVKDPDPSHKDASSSSAIPGSPRTPPHSSAQRPKPRTPEATARSKAAEKIRQELLARAKKVTRSPTAGRGGAKKSSLLSQYQQQQNDMMVALTQLYQQSGYSMAYASSLQAMTQGLYDYGTYGGLDASAMMQNAALAGSGLDASALMQSAALAGSGLEASALMQNAALAAAGGGMYPYGGIPMMNPETMAALGLGGTSASTSALSPGSKKTPQSSPSGAHRSPPSAQRSPSSATTPSSSATKQSSSSASKPQSNQHSSKPSTSVRPQQVSMKPQQATVKPQQSSVKPQQSTVKPQQSTVKPQQASVKPQQATVKPQQSTVKPQQSSVKPQQSTVKPHQSTVKPQQASVKPQQSTVKSQQVTVRPQQVHTKPQSTKPQQSFASSQAALIKSTLASMKSAISKSSGQLLNPGSSSSKSSSQSVKPSGHPSSSVSKAGHSSGQLQSTSAKSHQSSQSKSASSSAQSAATSQILPGFTKADLELLSMIRSSQMPSSASKTTPSPHHRPSESTSKLTKSQVPKSTGHQTKTPPTQAISRGGPQAIDLTVTTPPRPKLPSWGTKGLESPKGYSSSVTTTPSRYSATTESPSKSSDISMSSESQSMDVVVISSSQESDGDE